MKAAVLTSIGQIEIREVAEPEIISPTDVLLRIRRAGICGSDVHYYGAGRIGDQVVRYPFTVGHECSAVVEKTGDEVTRIKKGDRVAVDPAVACGTCDQCRSGRKHTCRSLRFLGCPGYIEGCLCEFIVMPEENCFPLSENVTFDGGALVEPLAIGVYAVDFLRVRNIENISILGCGPIGLSVLLAAGAAGIRQISATDKVPERLTAARKAGANWAENPDESGIVQDIVKSQGEMDAVFECCGDQAALDQAIDLLKPGGELLILGIPDSDRISFDIGKLRRKEIRLQNVRRQNRCTAKAIELIASQRIDVDFMTTHTFSLEETQMAFDLVSEYRDGVIKAMIRFE